MTNETPVTPEGVRVPPPPAAVTVNAVVLHSASFETIGSMPVAGDERHMETTFELSTSWTEEGLLGVQFGLAVEIKETCNANIVFRGYFRRPDGQEPKAREDPFWQTVAARLAPTMIYPYIRETFTSLALKAGAPTTLILPVINVGAIWKPDEVVITP